MNDPRARALRFLARREYSKAELRSRLSEEQGIEEVLDELEREGWLSDRRYVDQILNARLGHYGRLHVLQELRSKGISEELIADAMPRIMEAEMAALRSAWEKRFGKMPGDRRELGRQVRFLQGRGFPLEEIFKLIGKTEE